MRIILYSLTEIQTPKYNITHRFVIMFICYYDHNPASCTYTIFSPRSCSEFIFPPKAARHCHIYQIGNLIYSDWESVLHWEKLQTILFPDDTSLRTQKGKINNSRFHLRKTEEERVEREKMCLPRRVINNYVVCHQW